MMKPIKPAKMGKTIKTDKKVVAKTAMKKMGGSMKKKK